MELLDKAIKAYTNKSIETAQFMKTVKVALATARGSIDWQTLKST